MNKTERSATLVPAVGAQVERGVGPQRLYIVRIVREAYVLAADEDEAKTAQSAIERWEDYPTITAERWAGRHIEGWDDHCRVYGVGEGLSLRTAKQVDFAA